MKRRFLDLKDRKIGRLQPIEIDEEKSNGKITWWKCKCDCGTIKSFPRNTLTHSGTVSCGCFHKDNHFTGYKEISGAYWTGIRASAKKRNLVFEITIEEAWELFIKQDRRCALTGRELHLVRNYTHEYKKQNASIDRKDPTKGYTLDNIQWLDTDINYCKQSLTDDEFIKMCNEVVNHQNKLGAELENVYVNR